MACAGMTATAADPAPMNTEFNQDYYTYQVFTNDELQVAYNPLVLGGGSCSDGANIPSPATLAIPAQVTYEDYTYTVTLITPAGFFCLTELQEIELPSTLKWIRSSAFENCKVLKTLEIPDNVWRIDGNAFKDCLQLESVVIPYNVTKMASDAFTGCSSLEEVVNLADMTGSYHGALTGLPETCVMYVPVEALFAATDWTGTIRSLGPYFDAITPGATSVDFGKEYAHRLGVTVKSVKVNGQNLTPDAEGRYVASGLTPDTDYTVSLTAEVYGHLYADSFAVRTIQESGVADTFGAVGESRFIRPEGTPAAPGSKGLLIQITPRGCRKAVIK